MHYGHSYEDGHHQFAWELVTAWHGTAEESRGERSVGFKYGKMKGLKISPLLRGGTDRSYIIPLRETKLPYPSAAYPTLLRVPPPATIRIGLSPASSIYPREHLRASGSRNMPFFKQPIRHAVLATCVPPPSACGVAWKCGVYEIPVKTLLSGFSGGLGACSGRARTCKRFCPVGGIDVPVQRAFAEDHAARNIEVKDEFVISSLPRRFSLATIPPRRRPDERSMLHLVITSRYSRL